eukprot:COSAG05_NODE_9_length_39734_cov_180.598067_10_plen_472_part_00
MTAAPLPAHTAILELKRDFQERIRSEVLAGWQQRQQAAAGLRLRQLRERILVQGDRALKACEGCSSAREACERMLGVTEDSLAVLFDVLGQCPEWSSANTKYAEAMVTENALLVARFARAFRKTKEAGEATGGGQTALSQASSLADMSKSSGGGRLTVVDLSVQLKKREAMLKERLGELTASAVAAELAADVRDQELAAAIYAQMERKAAEEAALSSLQAEVSRRIAFVRSTQLASHASRDRLVQLRNNFRRAELRAQKLEHLREQGWERRRTLATSAGGGEGCSSPGTLRGRHTYAVEGSVDWVLRVRNLAQRFNCPDDVSADALRRFRGHAGHAANWMMDTDDGRQHQMSPGGRQRQQVEREEAQQITELFNELDEDGSATLDASEVSALCRRLGTTLSQVEVDHAVEEMGSYSSRTGGEIDAKAFAAWYAERGKTLASSGGRLSASLPPAHYATSLARFLVWSGRWTC